MRSVGPLAGSLSATLAQALPLSLRHAQRTMKTGSGIKNIVKFRLTGTPDGNLLVSFYHLDVFNQDAVNWHIADQLVEERFTAKVLYEGNLQNNTHYQSAIYNLLQRVEVYVNCVRIERVQ